MIQGAVTPVKHRCAFRSSIVLLLNKEEEHDLAEGIL
jgi:hypothetical protein